MAFPHFPYTDFHRLNADWILEKVRNLAESVESLASNVESWATRISNAEETANEAVTTANEAVTTANEARDSASAANQTANYANTTAQTATQTANQAQATANHADVTANNAVSYAVSQGLTSSQQSRARTNIGSPSTTALATQASRIDALESNSVSTLPQDFTVFQQVQARTNINAEEKFLEVWITKNETLTDWEASETFSDIQAAYSNGKNILVHLYDVTTNIDCKTLATINQSSSSVTAESMTAYFFRPALPGSLLGSTWHYVFMNSNALSVQEYSARLVPDPTSNEEGMVIQAVNGKPAWMPSETAIVHATLNTSTKVITAGDGFSFSNIQALVNDNRSVILRIVTQNNYVFYFPLAVIRGTVCYFYGTSLYPATTGYTKYNMYISLSSSNMATYLVTSETYIPE